MVMPSSSSSADNGSQAPAIPNPEVLEKAQRRIYTVEYKLKILQETDTCGEGQIGAILRREGLYSSHLTTWRQQRQVGQLAALSDHKQGRKPTRAVVLQKLIKDKHQYHLHSLKQQLQILLR